MENVRRQVYGGAQPKKRGARALVFFKIFTANKCRANKCRANCAGRDARAAGRDTRGAAIKTRIPVWSQKTAEIRQKSKNRAPRPPACLAGAWAMFLSNNHRKNDMNVSRETIAYFLGTSCPNIKLRLPIF